MLAASLGIMGQQGAQNPTGHDAFQDIDIDDFLKLMIAELQNQDPMNPMDNSEMLQQLGQMREITSNDRLSETLEAVLLGQNVATASSLMGQMIEGLTEDDKRISGRVERVSIVDGKPKLSVAGETIDLKNVSEIFTGSPGTTEDQT